MQFETANEKITAISDQDQWAGEVISPFVDENSRRVVIERVFVVPAFQGHGLGKQLMEHFIANARENNLTVKIMDPFAKQYFKQHPESQALLLPQDRMQ